MYIYIRNRHDRKAPRVNPNANSNVAQRDQHGGEQHHQNIDSDHLTDTNTSNTTTRYITYRRLF